MTFQSNYFKTIFVMLLVVGGCFSRVEAATAAPAPSYEEQVKSLGSKMVDLDEYDEASLKEAIDLVTKAAALECKNDGEREILFRNFFLYAYYYFRDLIHVPDQDLVKFKAYCSQLSVAIKKVAEKLFGQDQYLRDIKKTANSVVRDIYLAQQYLEESNLFEKVNIREGFGWAEKSGADLALMFASDSDLKAMFDAQNYGESTFPDKFFFSEKKVAADLRDSLAFEEKIKGAGAFSYEQKIAVLSIIKGVQFCFFDNPHKKYPWSWSCGFGIEQRGRRRDKGFICSNCGGCIANTNAIQFLDILIKMAKNVGESEADKSLYYTTDYPGVPSKYPQGSYYSNGIVATETVFFKPITPDPGTLLDELNGSFNWNLRIFAKEFVANYSSAGVYNKAEAGRSILSASRKPSDESALREGLVQIEDQIRASAESQSSWKPDGNPGVFNVYATQIYVNIADEFYEKWLKALLFPAWDGKVKILEFHNRISILRAMEKLCMTLLIQAGADRVAVEDVKKDLSSDDLKPCSEFLKTCLEKAAPKVMQVGYRQGGVFRPQFKASSQNLVPVDGVGEYEFIYYRHVQKDFIEKLDEAPERIRDWLKRVRELLKDLVKPVAPGEKVDEKFAADAVKAKRDIVMKEKEETKQAKIRAAQGDIGHDDWLMILRELHGDATQDPVKAGLIPEAPSALKIAKEKLRVLAVLRKATPYTDGQGRPKQTAYLADGRVQGYSANKFFDMAAALVKDKEFQDFVIKLWNWRGTLKDDFKPIYTGCSSFYISGKKDDKDTTLFDKEEAEIRKIMEAKAAEVVASADDSSESSSFKLAQQRAAAALVAGPGSKVTGGSVSTSSKPLSTAAHQAKTADVASIPVVPKKKTAFDYLFDGVHAAADSGRSSAASGQSAEDLKVSLRTLSDSLVGLQDKLRFMSGRLGALGDLLSRPSRA